jgi:phosphate uptake regulator
VILGLVARQGHQPSLSLRCNRRLLAPGIITFCVHLLFCTKNIERMGDHTTNIAEAIYYMIEGHTLLQERPKADNTTAVVTGTRARIGASDPIGMGDDQS